MRRKNTGCSARPSDLYQVDVNCGAVQEHYAGPGMEAEDFCLFYRFLESTPTYVLERFCAWRSHYFSKRERHFEKAANSYLV